MKSSRWTALFTIMAGLAMALPLHAQETASTKFNNAYRLVIRADIARDSGDHSGALELYTQAYNEHIRLMRDYPDWQPGGTRFRLEHCGREIVRLRKLKEEGLLREPPTQPLPEPETDGPLPTSVDYGDADAVRRLAAAQLARDQVEDARETVMKGLEQRPRQKQLTILLAAIQCRTGHFDGAIMRLRSLAKDYPNDATLRLLLATTYYGLGEEGGAVSELRRALKLDPIMTEAHYNLAQIMIHMTPPDVEGARYHYGKCIQLGGEPDAVLAAALKAPGPDAPTAPDSVTPQTKPDAPTPVTTAPEPDLDSTEGAEGEEPERKSWLRSILPW